MSVDKIYNHLCSWNIVYVLVIYAVIVASDYYIFGYHIKEPAVVMIVVGLMFLGLTSLARRLR